MRGFDLTEDDLCAIEIAQNVARRFLKEPRITPEQIKGLGNAIYCLERFPMATPGAFVDFGVIYESGTPEYREMRYIKFIIAAESFQILKGGSVYDQAVGSDSFSKPGWLVEINGRRYTGCELFDLEETISQYLNLGGEISVYDESEIDMEYEEPPEKSRIEKLKEKLSQGDRRSQILLDCLERSIENGK